VEARQMQFAHRGEVFERSVEDLNVKVARESPVDVHDVVSTFIAEIELCKSW
jgi:hypothetical protein